MTQLIQAPEAGSLSITLDGSPFSAWTLDDETGLITPDAPWPAGTYLTTFNYDHWVRFDSDFNAFSIDAPDAHNATIDLIEVRRTDP